MFVNLYKYVSLYTRYFHYLDKAGVKTTWPTVALHMIYVSILGLEVIVCIYIYIHILLCGILGNNSQYCMINHAIRCLLPSFSLTWC